MGNGDKKKFLEDFRLERGQDTAPPKVSEEKRSRKSLALSPHKRFLKKYEDLTNTISTFNATDLVYYFLQGMGESNLRYCSSSNFTKERATFKKLLKTYPPVEICSMIDFILESGQTYISKTQFAPHTLSSKWGGKIYQDMLSWAKGEYQNNVKGDKINKKEWKKGNETRIGVKL